MDRIIITGAAGFIGTNIARYFLEKGCHVTGTYHHREPCIEHPEFEAVKTDLRDQNAASTAIRDADALVMTAAFSGGAAVLSNNYALFAIDNTVMNMYSIEAAYNNGIKNVVFLSSGTIYPDTDDSFTEEKGMMGDPPDKFFAHGWNKRYGEVIGRLYAQMMPTPLNFTALRINNTYGPYDDFSEERSHVIPALIRRAVQRENPFCVWGDGKDIKDFMYVKDIAKSIECALDNMNGFQDYNIASGNTYTIDEILKLILKYCDYDDAKIVYDDSKPTMLRSRRINVEKAKKEIGFKATTTIEEGLFETIQWYKDSIGC